MTIPKAEQSQSTAKAAKIIGEALTPRGAPATAGMRALLKNLSDACIDLNLPVECQLDERDPWWLRVRISFGAVTLIQSGFEPVLVITWAGQNQVRQLDVLIHAKSGQLVAKTGADATVAIAEAFAKEVTHLIAHAEHSRQQIQALGLS